jgi:uncharacterized protein (DUF952 family)
MLDRMSLVYKVLPSADWQAAQREGAFHGSPVDLRDGFIHFSTAEQLAETLRRHFAGAADLILLQVDTQAVSPESAWRWEPSRGGALFPHLYAALPVSAVQSASPLPLGDDGEHQLPR